MLLNKMGFRKFYRNYVLCQGMVNFNMKDTIGRGIRKVFTEQQKRKIGNFLSTLKKKGIIKLTVGKRWVLDDV